MDNFIDTVALHPSVQAAVLCGSLMMNKYYALTDDSIAFCISLSMFRIFSTVRLVILILMLPVLHPRYKTSYFVKAGWKREWIKIVEDLVRQEWQSSYKPMVAMTALSPLTTAMTTTALSTV